MKKALFIINPVSGRKDVVTRLKEVLQVFTTHKYNLDLHFVVNVGDFDLFVKNFSKGKDLIVCAGGDGSLNAVVNAMMKYKVKLPLGYMPCGSTNDFGQTVHLSTDVVESAKSIVNGKIRQIDIGQFGNNYFVYVAAFGAFTKSSYSTPQDLKNLFGHFAYVMQGMSEIPAITEKEIIITTDTGEKIEGKYLLGAIANTRSIGGFIKLNDHGVSLSDGYLELMLVGFPKDFNDLNELINFANTKKAKSQLFTFLHAKSFTIKMKNDSMWSIDGEGMKIKKTQTFKNVKHAIKMILPK